MCGGAVCFGVCVVVFNGGWKFQGIGTVVGSAYAQCVPECVLFHPLLCCDATIAPHLHVYYVVSCCVLLLRVCPVEKCPACLCSW